MSALPSIADIETQSRDVRFVPIADITHRSERSLLFDHLVGAGEHRPGNGKTERLGALQVDDTDVTRGITSDQLDPSAKRPCTNTTFFDLGAVCANPIRDRANSPPSQQSDPQKYAYPCRRLPSGWLKCGHGLSFRSLPASGINRPMWPAGAGCRGVAAREVRSPDRLPCCCCW